MSFLSKMKPKYHHVVFRVNVGPPINKRSSREGLKSSWDLKKWKTSVFPYLIAKLNWSKIEEIIL